MSIANAESRNPSRRKSHRKKSSATALINSAFTDKLGISGRYGVSLRTVDNWMQERRIPYLKCGRLVRFNVSRCDAALSRFEIREVA